MKKENPKVFPGSLKTQESSTKERLTEEVQKGNGVL